MSHFYTGVNDVQFILFIRLLPFFSSLLTQPFEWLLHLFCSHCFLFQGCSIWRNQTWRPANYESTCMCLYPLCLCRHKTGYANYSYNQDTELAAECGNNYSKIFNLNSTSSSGANSGGGGHVQRAEPQIPKVTLCILLLNHPKTKQNPLGNLNQTNLKGMKMTLSIPWLNYHR